MGVSSSVRATDGPRASNRKAGLPNTVHRTGRALTVNESKSSADRALYRVGRKSLERPAIRPILRRPPLYAGTDGLP